MGKIKLNLCSVGDPANPKTWSGTPLNLLTELKKRNYLGYAFDSRAGINNYQLLLMKAISKVYYKNSVDIGRGLLIRNLYAKNSKKQTERNNSSLTLHTGTLDLPFCKQPNGQKHYLYCDSTWNLWSAYSKSLDKYSKKLLIDAEILEAKAYHQMEHIFPISEYVAKDLVEHYKVHSNKITVVGTGLGVITPYYGEKHYTNGKILFAAKRGFEDKGGLLVLEAFKIAFERNRNLELTIVGQNDYTERIDLPNVKTYGFLTVAELQNIFNESSLFLMPAINEPWGLVYLEAMACKMPIIGLNRNSFPEISDFGKYGFGLDDENPVRLSEIILDAFDNPEQLAEIG